MKNFGNSVSRDFDTIRQIILDEQLDVVALQEILSEGKGIRRLLEANVKNRMFGWDFRWGSPKDTSDPEKLEEMIHQDRRGEGYAFLWNSRKLKLVEYLDGFSGETRTFEPRIINSQSLDIKADCSFFARTPYFIRLQPTGGRFFELRLINMHIYFGNNTISEIQKRQLEFNVLVQQIYPQICRRRYGNNRSSYTIAMGDYNLNIFRPAIETQVRNAYLTEVYRYKDGNDECEILTLQDQLTTLKSGDSVEDDANPGYANNYDHFTYSSDMNHGVPVYMLYEKFSRKRRCYTAQCNTWGSLSPVTRKQESRKAYKCKKA